MSLEGKSADEIAALAALADDVLSKPETSGIFQRLVKRNNPGVSMPMIELEDKAVAVFNKQGQEINNLNAKLAQREAQDGANALFEALRDAGSVSNKNDFNGLVKYASENGFMTSENGLKKAASMRQQEQEAAEPTPSSIGQGLFRTGANEDESKKFFANPLMHSRNVAAQAMDELRKMRTQGNKSH
jgi:hypothetical protein